MPDLSNLFDSPPGPPPRLPSRTPSLSPGPARRETPLFLSPGSAIHTPQAARKRRTGDERGPVSPPRRLAFSPSRTERAVVGREAGPSRANATVARDGRADTSRPVNPQNRGRMSNGQDGNNALRERIPNGVGASRIPDEDELFGDEGLEEVFDPFAGLSGANGAGMDDEAEGTGKKRRVMPKVDAERLLGENGFPALMKAAKRFRPRGKGHEAHNLKALLNVYQIWAHGMFPKGDFAHTISRVEKVCRTRRMESALKGYRDAFYPPPPTEALTPPHTAITPPLDHVAPTDSVQPGAVDAVAGIDEFDAGITPRSTLFDPAPEDEPDMDELLAMEEMEAMGEGQDRSRHSGVEKVVARFGLGMESPTLKEDEWEGLYD